MDGDPDRTDLRPTTSPRCRVTRTFGPTMPFAAVAPRTTTSSGRTRAISASSHGRQARTSYVVGVWWIRRLPRGFHLKCFTMFVT